MDNSDDSTREDAFTALAAKHRFESFRLGKGLPSSHTTPNFPKLPHSRSTSISSSVSAPSFSATNNPNISSNHDSHLSNGSSKRPNSHHRRRSSVSTRRESADMMGVAVPDLPASSSDDNINLGDKDSIRRRALWALEGKPDLPYSKVEIPELVSPETEKSSFDFPSRPSYPPGGAGYNGGLNSLMVKRDSFKLLASSSSSKDQLHTLVEEEEEEEDMNESDAVRSPQHGTDLVLPAPLVVTDIKPIPARPRPAKLSLRPLSLTPDNLASKFHGLPTPPSTGSSLKSSPAPSIKPFLSMNSSDDLTTMNAMKPMQTPSPTPSLTCRSSPSSHCESPSPLSFDEQLPKRRSSISYKNSHSALRQSITGLPTPDLTPTSERRYSGFSSSGTDDDFPHSRPLSASEQHFLFKSHNALLARITDLERALSSRSRPLSSESDVSSNATSEPSDEMLRLLTDLKAERDELKRDVDGWRTRVGDLEKQIGIYARRVEAERRDAWVARSRVGLFEVEKTALEKGLEQKTLMAQETQRKYDELKDECAGLRASLAKLHVDVKETEAECTRLRAAYEEESSKRVELERELAGGVDLLATPTAHAFTAQATAPPARTANRDSAYTIADSESSTTDVESVDGLRLKVVVEEDDADIYDDDEENELLHYEDEDSDISFESPGSSCESLDDIRRSTSPNWVRGPVPPHPNTDKRTSHAPHSSLSKTWTFPRNLKPTSTEREEVDHFFGCLEDVNASPPLASVPSTYEVSKGLFCQALNFGTDNEDDDMPPFLLPRDVGVEAEVPKATLDVVIEEDEEEHEQDKVSEEDEFTGDMEVGGIKIVFTPPQPDNTSMDAHRSPPAVVNKPVLCYEPFSDDEEDFVPFNFGRPIIRQTHTETPPRRAQVADTGKKVPSPSSIPRAASFKTPSTTTPPKLGLGRFIPPSGYVTPPSKRGGASPSFIPQPVSGNSPPPKQRASPTSTFIPQPQRKSTYGSKGSSTFQPQPALSRSPECTRRASPSSSAEMSNVSSTNLDNSIPKHEYPKGQETCSTNSISSIMSSPFATRLSTFIPLSWAASQVKPVAAAALSLITESSSSGSAAESRDEDVCQEVVCNGMERRERKYVSKEQQLEKLRNRLYINEGASDMCKRCQDDTVSL